MQFSLLVQNRGRAEEAHHLVEDGVDPQRCIRAPILFWTVCVFASYIPFHSRPCMRQYAILKLQNTLRERGNSLGLRPGGPDVRQRGKCNKREHHQAIFNLTKCIRSIRQIIPYRFKRAFHDLPRWAFRPVVHILYKQSKFWFFKLKIGCTCAI